MNLRWKQLRQTDLNLLVAFAVFAEELSVSSAAKRLLLSQSAASRTLDRLRTQFNDDLMVRSSGGYQLTPAGTRLARELERLLPELEALMGKPVFDAVKEEASFRITGPDNVCAMLCPLLCREVLPKAPRVKLIFIPWSETAIADVDRGRVDLVLSNDEVLVPTHLRSQRLYRERFWCIVARGSRWPERLTLKRYLEAEHIAVSLLDGVQSIPEKRLAILGKSRRWSIRMAYFGAALECVAGTELILTATSSAARVARARRDLRVIEVPPELTGFGFQAIWHPRAETDPAHMWLRRQIVALAKTLDREPGRESGESER
ncbi:MAG TPA: LysR family transcriptional regulator [Edaphobacter sp.]|jgi:DNA-binding transcriptional LysR family regulator|nr:LysR family transcriptional regulator [Edaphobacter sp.]